MMLPRWIHPVAGGALAFLLAMSPHTLHPTLGDWIAAGIAGVGTLAGIATPTPGQSVQARQDRPAPPNESELPNG